MRPLGQVELGVGPSQDRWTKPSRMSFSLGFVVKSSAAIDADYFHNVVQRLNILLRRNVLLAGRDSSIEIIA